MTTDPAAVERTAGRLTTLTAGNDRCGHNVKIELCGMPTCMIRDMRDAAAMLTALSARVVELEPIVRVVAKGPNWNIADHGELPDTSVCDLTVPIGLVRRARTISSAA